MTASLTLFRLARSLAMFSNNLSVAGCVWHNCGILLVRLNHALKEGLRLVQLAPAQEEEGEVVHRLEGVRVQRAQLLLAPLERAPEELLSLVHLILGPEQLRHAIHRVKRLRMERAKLLLAPV
jgi:hypothetical protein